MSMDAGKRFTISDVYVFMPKVVALLGAKKVGVTAFENKSICQYMYRDGVDAGSLYDLVQLKFRTRTVCHVGVQEQPMIQTTAQ